MAPAAIDPVGTLLQAYLFEGVSPAELQVLAARTTVRSLARGAYAVRTGDPAESLIVVADGQLKTSVVTPDGEEMVFHLTTRGGVLGEPGLFAVERSRLVSIVAMRPTVILEVPREALVDFLLQHPPAMLRLLEGLAEALRAYTEWMVDLGFERVRDRVVRKLLDFATTHGQERPDGSVELTLAISQSTLAGMVAASRENVNRALQQLAASGHVFVSEQRFVIRDLEGLQGIAKRGMTPTQRRNRHRGPGARALSTG